MVQRGQCRDLECGLTVQDCAPHSDERGTFDVIDFSLASSSTTSNHAKVSWYESGQSSMDKYLGVQACQPSAISLCLQFILLPHLLRRNRTRQVPCFSIELVEYVHSKDDGCCRVEGRRHQQNKVVCIPDRIAPDGCSFALFMSESGQYALM